MEVLAKIKGGLEWGIRLALACLFIWAGVVKAWNPSVFASELAHYQLLPYALIWGLSLYLPYLEMLCGVCLLGRFFYEEALLLIGAMLLVFIGAVGSAWLRGLDISCGCFGGAGKKGDYDWVIIRDLFMLIGVGALLICRKAKNKHRKETV